MKKIAICLLFLCVVVGGMAQNLKGRITNQAGEPIAGANLYVRETLQGSAANENGEFQLYLAAGTYNCDVSALGFEKQALHITLTEESYVLNVCLQPTVYMLPEVRITNTGEDPAYYIMRKAISRASFHRNRVDRYVSEIYTKGNMKLDKVPKVLLWGSDMKETIKPLIGKLMLLESVTEVNFSAPDYYESNVVAFSSTIPDLLDPGEILNIMTTSIYDPVVIGMTSPLAPGAFSYYRFQLEEAYVQDGRTISKIGVDPKKSSNQLVKGWLYIEDENWGVVNFNLTAEMFGSTADIKGVFHEINPGLFLPTSYDIDVDVKTLGVRAVGKYYSGIKYKEVHQAAFAAVADTVARDTVVPASTGKQERIVRQIEELAEKDGLTDREAYKMARLTQELVENKGKDTLAPMELRWEGSSSKVRVDSLATRKDSLFWARIRTVPLQNAEVASYRSRDSLQVATRSRGGYTPKSVLGKVFTGGEFRLRSGVDLKVAGLIGAVPEYNFVDGFWLGQKADLNISLKDNKKLILSPSIHYATARKTLLWDLGVRFRYAGMRRGDLLLKFGKTSFDFKQQLSSWRLENALTSLVYGHNYMKFYDAEFFHIENRIDVANGLNLTIGGQYEKRKILENHISYNLFKKDADPNVPVEGIALANNRSAAIVVRLAYNPRIYYREWKGQKHYADTDWPWFYLSYRKGISLGAEHQNVYDRLEGGLTQNIECGIFDKISYALFAGKFFSVKELHFPDYKHFGSSGWIVNSDSFFADYFRGDYYRLSTCDKWLRGALNYTSSYLLLKRLPFLQSSLMTEGLHVRYLWTPHMKNYMECGYSIGLSGTGRVGVFFSFDRNGYEGVGVRLSLPFSGRE